MFTQSPAFSRTWRATVTQIKTRFRSRSRLTDFQPLSLAKSSASLHTSHFRMSSKDTEPILIDNTNSATKRKMPAPENGAVKVPATEKGAIKLSASENRGVMRFAKLSEHAKAPTKGSTSAAGYDLYSAYDYTVKAGGKEIVKTDIQIAVPDDCYGRVAPRSGLAAKNFIDVGAGVIDKDYRGNVGIVLFNFGEQDFVVNKGDRVAQLICEKICYPELEELDKLDDTERGSGGYGSTGKN